MAIGGTNNIHPDLDYNLYTDSYGHHGYNALLDAGIISQYGAFQPQDEYGHGTHVSGIISATTNNNIGIDGVLGGNLLNKGVDLYSVKCSKDQSQIYLSAASTGVFHTFMKGIKINNCSFGYRDPNKNTELSYLINYLSSNSDVFFVCSAGNEGDEVEREPSSFDRTISVAASDINDKVTQYSTRNYKVDITAPGGDGATSATSIYSTLPDNNTFTVYNECGTQTYGNMSGTSMAAPMVTSAIALVKQEFPNLSFEEVRDRVIGTADDISYRNQDALIIGKYGSGRLNIYKAITDLPHPTIRLHEISADGSRRLPMNATGLPIDIALKNWWINCNSPITGTLTCLDPEVTIQNNYVTWQPLQSRNSDFSNNPFIIDINTTSFGEVAFELEINVDGVIETLYFSLKKRTNLTDFTSNATLSGYEPSSELVVGDIDNDEVEEVAFLCNNGLHYKLVLYRDGVLYNEVVGTAAHEKPVFADMDGDGIKEIIVATLNPRKVLIYDKCLQFVTSYDLPDYTDEVTSFLVNDINEDGMLDIVVAVDNIQAMTSSYLKFIVSSDTGYQEGICEIPNGLRILSDLASSNIDDSSFDEIVFVVTTPVFEGQNDSGTVYYSLMKITLSGSLRGDGLEFDIEGGSESNGDGGVEISYNHAQFTNYNSTELIISNPHPSEINTKYPHIYFNIGYCNIAVPVQAPEDNSTVTHNRTHSYDFSGDLPLENWSFGKDDIPNQYLTNYSFLGGAGNLIGGDFIVSNPGIELVLSTFSAIIDSESGEFIQFINNEFLGPFGPVENPEYMHVNRRLTPYVMSDSNCDGTVELITYQISNDFVITYNSNGQYDPNLSLYLPEDKDVTSIASGYFENTGVAEIIYLMHDNQNLYIKKSTLSDYQTDFTIQWAQNRNNSRSTSEFLQPLPVISKSDCFVWNDVELKRDADFLTGELEIAPGIEFCANYERGLYVDDKITSLGMNDNKIEFKGLCDNNIVDYWKGIKVGSKSTLSTKYASYSNCKKALALFNCRDTDIAELEFINNRIGLEVYNSSVSLDHCSFDNNDNSTTRAIILNNDAEIITSNAYNIIINHKIGFDFYESAGLLSQGYNNIDNEEYNIKTFKPLGEIIAQNNWWGSNSPSIFVSKFSDQGAVIFADWLDSAPARSLESVKNEFNLAESYRINEDYQSALNSYFTVYNDSTDTSLKYLSITGLYKCYYALNQLDNFKTWIESEITLNADIDLDLSLNRNLAMVNRDLGNYDLALNYYEGVIEAPLTYVDSCFAVIDIGFTVLDSDNRLQSKYSRLNPESYHEHYGLTEKLLDSIYNNRPIENNDNSSVIGKPVLHSNYPNPFNPTTTISFYNNRKGNVKVDIYNVRGQLVKSLINENLGQGNHKTVWHGTNNSNKKVASGVYFYRLRSNNKTLTKKCLLLK